MNESNIILLKEVLAQIPRHLLSKPGADSGRDSAGGRLSLLHPGAVSHLVEMWSWGGGGCLPDEQHREWGKGIVMNGKKHGSEPEPHAMIG